ncbi:hypothetical protein [Planococcus sp. CAU13]|uniref:hypothetical protein n=1 Tax=Planococcus sp. CAU13 TaxID=1541197 RepID=UPI00052FF26B|nr:hypothetical protein [Planococcus sp. CAU13]
MHTDYENKKLYALLSEYSFLDLVAAVYCLNSWRRNRETLNIALELNAALVKMEKNSHSGLKRISTYKDFISLFEEVLKVTQNSPFNDPVVSDFGEVNFFYKKKFYPIIIGTGYENSYASLFISSQLVKETGEDFELKSLFEYMELTIETLYQHNLKDDAEDSGLNLPKEEYFKAVHQLMSYIFRIDLNKRLIHLLHFDNIQDIERTHFFGGSHSYPLFNASIYEDFLYQITLRAKNVDFQRMSEMTLLEILNNNYSGSLNSNNILYPVSFAAADSTNSTQIYFSFLLRCDKGYIAFYNKDIFPSDFIYKDLENINKLHLQDELIAYEAVGKTERKAYRIPRNIPVIIKSYTSYSIEEEFRFASYNSGESIPFSLNDMINILNFADSFDEIYAFLRYLENASRKKLITFSGFSADYLLWKTNTGDLNEGGIVPDLIIEQTGSIESVIYDYFSQTLKDYPFRSSLQMFELVHSWNVRKDDDSSFTIFTHKDYFSEVHGKIVNEKIAVYLEETKFVVEDIEREELPILRSVSDVLKRQFLEFQNEVICLSNYENVNYKYTLVSKTILLKNMNAYERRNFNEEGYLNFKIIENSTENKHCLYTVDWKKASEKLMSSIDRTFENELFVELLSPFFDSETQSFDDFQKEIFKTNSDKKSVGLNQVEINYFIAPSTLSEPTDFNFKRIKKWLARIYAGTAVKSGIYKGKEVRDIVRTAQKIAVAQFEERISKFDQKDLHYKLLNDYSLFLFEKDIHNKRLTTLLEDNNLLLSEKERFKQKTIELREENKKNLRQIQYLIEENLIIERETPRHLLSTSDYLDLLAISHWLIVLQDAADLAHNDIRWIAVEIKDDYQVNTIVEEEIEKRMQASVRKNYDFNSYEIKKDKTNMEFYELFEEAFYKDTDIRLKTLFDVLTIMSEVAISENPIIHNVLDHPNVFKVQKDEIIYSISQELSLSEREVATYFNFIALERKMVKYIGDEEIPVIPIWERKKRNNRFDVKPLITFDRKEYIFSPASMHFLRQNWIFGIFDFYLPYEYELNKSMKIITMWKKRYEKEIVIEVENSFKEVGYKEVYSEIEIYKFDTKGDHNKNLGDYDLIVVDEKNAIVWLIECKFIRKSGSIFEFYTQQQEYFLKNKNKADKFEKRVSYFNENIQDIMKNKNYKDQVYQVRPCLVTNKNFDSYLRDVTFEVISTNELKSILKLEIESE